MPYSLDLRQKVINFVENGGTITKAAHTFGIGRASIYRWLSRPKLSATKVKSRQIKLDWKELENDIEHDLGAFKRARMYSPINTSRLGNYS